MLKPFQFIGSAIFLTVVSILWPITATPPCWGAMADVGGQAEASLWNRLGLSPAWSTVAQLDRRVDRVRFVQLHVHQESQYTVFEVISPRGVDRYSSRDLDLHGMPLGEAQGQARAEQRSRDLQAMGYTAEVRSQKLAQVRLYVQSELGLLQALDAESGRSLWVKSIGVRGDRVFPISVHGKRLAVVSGTSVQILDAATGAEIWQRKMEGTPQAGPALSEHLVVIPRLNGMVDGLKIPVNPDDPPQRVPARFVGAGFTMQPPAAAGNLVAWGTDHGVVNLATLDPPRTRFRIRTSPIYIQPVFRTATEVVFIDEPGYVKAFDTVQGKILWQTSTGKSIDQPPVAIDDELFVATRHDGLLALRGTSGDIVWQTPGIASIASLSADAIYAQTHSSGLTKLDRKTGAVVAQGFRSGELVRLTNTVTDRIYAVEPAGHIVCLHEVHQSLPLFHVPPTTPPAAEPAADPAAPPDEPEPTTPEPSSAGETGTTDAQPDENPFAEGDSETPAAESESTESEADPIMGDDEADPFASP